MSKTDSKEPAKDPQANRLDIPELRRKILCHLKSLGYSYENGSLVPPDFNAKQDIRDVYSSYRNELLLAQRNWLEQNEPTFRKYFIDGKDLEPARIQPKLKLVETDEERKLFKYCSLMRSVPVSQGYGRRLRYLVLDLYHGSVIGILGLGDPVFNLGPRDTYIGWTWQQKRERLWHIMDVYVLGAVHPYSYLLGGKLVALLALSDEVRADFRKKYSGTVSIISRVARPPYLVALTTTAALGRSSVLNRLKYNGRLVWQPIGWTSGWGHFHLNGELFSTMLKFLRQNKDAVVQTYKFGGGANWRFRVIKKCLSVTGLGGNTLRHGVLRQVFFAPLAENAIRFLRGEVKRPTYYRARTDFLVDFFKERWMLPRAERSEEWKAFKRDSITILPEDEN